MNFFANKHIANNYKEWLQFLIDFFPKNCKLKPDDIIAYQSISGFWQELEFFLQNHHEHFTIIL